jgi:hypothetical protein
VSKCIEVLLAGSSIINIVEAEVPQKECTLTGTDSCVGDARCYYHVVIRAESYWAY